MPDSRSKGRSRFVESKEQPTIVFRALSGSIEGGVTELKYQLYSRTTPQTDSNDVGENRGFLRMESYIDCSLGIRLLNNYLMFSCLSASLRLKTNVVLILLGVIVIGITVHLIHER